MQVQSSCRLYMEQLKPPHELSLKGNLAEKCRKWIQSFELFLKLTKKTKKFGVLHFYTRLDAFATDLKTKAKHGEYI